MTDMYEKGKDLKYQARDAALKMQQNFQALLSMNDRKFMEHVRLAQNKKYKAKIEILDCCRPRKRSR